MTGDTAEADQSVTPPRAIIAIGNGFDCCELERCPPEIAERLANAIPGRNTPKIKFAFEAFLQIREHTVSPHWKRSKAFGQIVAEFIGALNSPSFIELEPNRRTGMRGIVRKVFEEFPVLAAVLEPLRGKDKGIRTEELKRVTRVYETGSKNADATTYWSGWPVVDARGKTFWLHLGPLQRQLGVEFCNMVHELTLPWVRARHLGYLPCLNELVSYIRTHRLSELKIASADGHEFWLDFWEHIKCTTTERWSLQKRQDYWNSFTRYAKDTIIKAGLFPTCEYGMPGPMHDKEIPRPPLDKDWSGLLISVPPSMSERKTIEHLMAETPKVLAQFKTWAGQACARTFSTYLQRRRLVRALAREGSTDAVFAPTDDSALAAAAATYELHGHGGSVERNQSLYGGGLYELAEQLGTPTTASLVPFAAMLVLHHPQITPAFLESLEFWNKHGKAVGLIRSGGTVFLVGKKQRKGRHGVQRIPLTPATHRLVLQLLCITRVAREGLKKAGNKSWRQLFISTRGFAAAKPFNSFSSSVNALLPEIAKQFSAIHKMPLRKAEAATRKFSLRSARSLAALDVLFEEKTEASFSRALGHEGLNRRLLARYLPAAIIAFLQATLLAAFQTGLVVKVMAGSKHQLRASRFKSVAEMEAFMDENRFHSLDDILAPPSPSAVAPARSGRPKAAASNRRFYFAASPASLRCLAVIRQRRLRALPGHHKSVWCDISVRMFEHLESRRGRDPELDAMVDESLKNAENFEFKP